MRRYMPALIMVLVLCCAAPALAKASYLNVVHLGLDVGAGFVPRGRIDNNNTLDDAEFSNASIYDVGGRAEIRINPSRHAFFGLAGRYSASRGTIDLNYDLAGDVTEREITMQNTSVEMLFGWQFLNRNVRPYIYGGMGYAISTLRMVYDEEDHRVSLNGNNLPFFVVGGLDYMVKERVSIGGELRGEYLYNLMQYGTGDIEVRMDYVPVSAEFHVGIHF